MTGARAQTSLGPLELSGSVTASGEAYGASGIEARRPGLLGRVGANARFSLFGIGTRLSLSLSSDEGTEFRQDLDRIRLATRWSWGEAELGDVSPTLSPYVLSGLTPRGGLLQLRRSGVEILAGGGRTRQAESGITAEGNAASGAGLQAYEQYLWAGRVRVGNPSGTFGGLSLAVARDVAGSLDEFGLDAEDFLLRPRASATLAPEAGVSLLDGAIRLRGLAATSAFTPDLDAASGDGEIPGYLRPLTVSRAGAFAQNAYEADLFADLAALGLASDLGLALDASYSRVAPGYRTLGAPRLRDDEATFRLRPRATMLEGRLALTGDFSRTATNLSDQEIASGERLGFGGTVLARPTEWLSLTAAYNGLRNEREAGVFGSGPQATPDPGLLQTTQTVTLAPTLSLRRESGLTHTATLATTLVRSRDRSADVLDGTRPGAEADNASGAASYAFAAPSGLTLTATADAARSALGENSSLRTGLTLGAGQAFLERALNLAASAGVARTTADYAVGSFTQTQFTGTLTGTYRLASGDALRLQVTGFTSAADAGAPSFQEVRARVAYSRRF